MLRLTLGMKGLICLLLLAGVPVVCQQQNQNLPDNPAPKPQSQQNIPDAPQPKADQPNQFPENAPPAPKNVHPDQPDTAPTPAPIAAPISLRTNFLQLISECKKGPGSGRSASSSLPICYLGVRKQHRSWPRRLQLQVRCFYRSA